MCLCSLGLSVLRVPDRGFRGQGWRLGFYRVQGVGVGGWGFRGWGLGFNI